MTRYPEIQQEDDSQIKYQMKNFAVFSAHLKKKKKKKKKKRKIKKIKICITRFFYWQEHKTKKLE
jgi:hypothetical protein